MSYTERVVVLVDMDCFYCQVEENLNPAFKGKPLAVVQYNAWKGGGIIAVNYPAREKGVTRHMRGDEAKQKCPEIELVRVPNVRAKADLSKYREAGKLVAKVLQKFTPLLERASVDEAYLDITSAVQERIENATKEIDINDVQNTHIAGGDTATVLYNLYSSGLLLERDLRLAFGAAIVEEIRSAVFKETGYTCSAGIAHNKILAKLACGLNKPNKQTILLQDNVPEVYKNLPVCKIRNLGGKFGESLAQNLGINNMAELVKFTENELARHYDEKTAHWLYDIARGIDREPVTTRLLAKSIACCKKFPGKSALIKSDSVQHWLNELALEIIERLNQDFEENNRKAKQLVVSFSQESGNGDVSSSRTLNLRSYDLDKIVSDAFEVIKKNCLKSSGTYCIKFLGLSAGKFDDYKNGSAITSFFKAQSKSEKADDADKYSDVTIDLNEDDSNLVFFQENAPVDNVSDCDSISNEILNVYDNSEPENNPSFFHNYLNNLKVRCKSPVKRDFDTSLALDDTEDSLNTDSTSDNSKASTSYNTEIEDISVCKECNKKVPATDLLTHMDYHFAVQIVKEESKLHKTSQPLQSKVSAVKKSTKRKISGPDQNSLLKFLKSDSKEDNETSGELCQQCNKYIKGDFVSHLDYHAAKKLHMEINPVSSSCKVTVTNKDKGNKKSSKQSITHFFKPTT